MKKCIILLFVYFFLFSVSTIKAEDVTKFTSISDQRAESLAVLTKIIDIFFGNSSTIFSGKQVPNNDAQSTTFPSVETNSSNANTTPYSGSIINPRQLLPDVLPSLTSNAATAKPTIIFSCLPNKAIYMEAQRVTGVPWQYLAGIHMVEGGCGSSKSLVSGRTIGEIEPDVGDKCATEGLGKPYSLAGGGCGFHTLLDTAIYAGELLKVKNTGSVPSSFQEAVQTAALYNGPGNTNCDNHTTFEYCPPRYTIPFPYWDHIHPMNYFDEYHERMYVVYCADKTLCSDLGKTVIYRMPGVMTTMRILVEGGY